jgi:hypothetical protein
MQAWLTLWRLASQTGLKSTPAAAMARSTRQVWEGRLDPGRASQPHRLPHLYAGDDVLRHVEDLADLILEGAVPKVWASHQPPAAAAAAAAAVRACCITGVSSSMHVAAMCAAALARPMRRKMYRYLQQKQQAC